MNTDFNVSATITKELADFNTKKISLVGTKQTGSARFLSNAKSSYMFNQADTINLIDLYWNSKFENGEKDDLGQRKMFLNVGKFRSEVAAKQIDLDVKDFRFIPDDYADTWPAFFMQKDFREYNKDHYFGELLNTVVDSFPKYGTVVLKHVGKEIQFVPLQVLRNEQTADTLEDSAYVIEEHEDMRMWNILDNEEWDTDGLELLPDKCYKVYERYGHAPLGWINEYNNRPVSDGDWDKWVDAMIIVTFDTAKEGKTENEHIFFCDEITKRPYEEAHWDKQHGRWLGVGVVEDQFENQVAKNIIVNLIRRSMHWSSKKLFQTAKDENSAKNLVRDVADGTILSVGQGGDIAQVNTQNQSLAEFTTFLNEWEKNSDQKAFSYDVATGQNMASGTPFRLGVLLSNAVNQYFEKKREKLGLFMKRVVNEFLLPQFIKDMSNKERVVTMFSDEPGFEALKDAAMKYVSSEAVRESLLAGKPIDSQTITDAIQPLEAVNSLFLTVPEGLYKDVKYKFELVITGEEDDTEGKVKSLMAIYQSLVAAGDPRAEKVLERMAAYGGVNMATLGLPMPKAPMPAMPNQPQQGQQNAPKPAPTA